MNSFIQAFICLLLCCSGLPAQNPNLQGNNPVKSEKYSVLKVFVTSPLQLREMAEADVDFDHIHGDMVSGVEMYLTHSDVVKLDDLGIKYEIVIDDFHKFYEERSIADQANLANTKAPAANFGYGSVGGFYTFAEIEAKLDEMHNLFPSITTAKYSIGTSIEGRDIWALKISDNPNIDEPESVAYYDALHHAREPLSMAVTINYMFWLLENYNVNPAVTYIINNRELYFVPVVNPDGYDYNRQTNPNGGGLWRKNRRGGYGVDLNRNYGYQWGFNNSCASSTTTSETYKGTAPFSEPETAAVRDFVNQIQPTIAFSTHATAGSFLMPYGYNSNPPDFPTYAEWASDFLSENDYPYGTTSQMLGYTSCGTTRDYLHNEGIYAWTPEIDGSGFWPAQSEIFDLVDENVYPMFYQAWIAGGYADVQSHKITGEATPGSTIQLEVELKNKGAGASADNLVVEIVPNSSLISVDGTRNYGSIAARQTKDNFSDKFNITVDPAFAGGAFDLEIKVFQDGTLSKSETIEVSIGTSNVLFGDNAENGMGNWTTAGNGIPWSINTDDSYSGNQSFGDSNGSNFTNSTLNGIFMQSFVSLANADIPFLEYFAKWSFEPGDYVQLQVATNGGTNWTTLKTYNAAETWTQEKFNLSAYIGSTVRFRFVLTSDADLNTDGFYFDDFMIVNYSCPSCPVCATSISSFPYSESFENGLGDWDQGNGADIDWISNSGGTASNGTGPSAASNGSIYMYVESSNPNYPDKSALMTSPCFNLTAATQADFGFDYNMYGNQMGSLGLDISLDDGLTWTEDIWTISGDQGQNWQNVTVDLSNYLGEYVKLRFDGTTGSGFRSDMAVDNVSLSATQQSCSVGSACDDGDVCTTGETYDNNCNCSGGVFQDSDNDGICDAQDPCDDNNPISILGSIAQPLCHLENGFPDGEIIISISNGTAPYTFSWTSFGGNVNPTSQNQVGLSDGEYSVVVTDNNGCSAEETFFLYSPEALSLVGTITDVSCNIQNGFPDGSIATVATGGTAPYVYFWQTPDGTGLDPFSADQSGLSAGTYFVTMTDANACEYQDAYTLTEPDPIGILTTVVQPGCSNSSGEIITLTSGGTGNYTYEWDGPLGLLFTQNITGLPAGTYSLLVTDDNGCTQTHTEILTSNSAGMACDDGDACTINDTYDVNCNCAGTFADDDQDGVCDANDICPGEDDNLDSDGDGIPDGCDNCNTPGATCDDGDACTINDTYDSNCNCAGTFADDDQDGVCDANDICPGEDDNLDSDGDGIPDGCDNCNTPGATCDDGDACTINDTYDVNCNCAGTFADDDQDGVCDANDICPGEDDNLDSDGDGIPDGCDNCNTPGATCDDGDACTINDTYDVNCNCAGTFADDDQDGVCDANDICPGEDDNLDSDGDGIPDGCDNCNTPGATCDDGDACTINDTYDVNCNCAGTFADDDQDGVCDANDICPGEDDNLDSDGDGIPDGCDNCNTPGATCDDGDACTINDTYDVNCNCAGTFADDDQDGVCDANDICPGEDDNLDSDGDGIPDGCDNCNTPGATCDDGDACTINDTYDVNCNCAGTFADDDQDGVCDANDICPGEDDNLDSDGDGIPDGCDNCNTPGATCDDGDACTINDTYDVNCNCAGTFADDDQDGVCDANDICPGEDDNLDSDGDGIPDGCDNCNTPGATCDDGDACTINDTYDVNCNCAGTFADSDNDGICDALDLCDDNNPITIVGSIAHPLCHLENGFPDGEIIISVSNGTAPYTFNWTSPTGNINATSQNQIGLGDGEYTVVVTDNNGCSAAETFFLYSPEALDLVGIVTDVSCNVQNGFPDGSIATVATGGTAPYVYFWQTPNGAGLDPFSADQYGLSAGTYFVTMTDANACEYQDAYTLTEPDPISTLTTVVQPGCGNATGEIITLTSGGTGNYTYEWDGPLGLLFTQNITGAPAGTYSLLVTDDNGCTEVHTEILTSSSAGKACDDGDPCTTGETYDTNCGCTGGVYEDTDEDGVCDTNDICPGFNDNIDTDGDGIPDGCDTCNTEGASCDDGDACTVNDIYDADCNCAGTFMDSDNDGICDADDSCPNDNTNNCITTLCESFGSNTQYEYIESVTIGAITNTSGDNSGYGDYLSIAMSGMQGENVAIELTPGFGGGSYLEFWNVWIDFNKDGNLNNAEELLYSGSSPSTITGQITIPASVDLGDYMMRISMRYNQSPASCGGFLYGEVEDYTFTVNSATACTAGTPCNDGDDCTVNDILDSNCDCSGTFMDSDGDGVCDSDDTCPNGDDTVDNNNNGVGDACEGCPSLNLATIQTYDTTEDNGTAEIHDGGSTVRLTGNAWKALPVYYTVTSNTVITFDFKSTVEGEIHELSFDNDLNAVPEQRIVLYGNQGIAGNHPSVPTYSGSGDWESYTIELGQLFTGNFDYLILTADDDATGNGTSYFRNVVIFEDMNGNLVCEDEVIEICPNLDDDLIGTPCDDGDSCTTGELYDMNCGCSGGVYTDADGDGYCIGEDADDNDACVPDGANCVSCETYNFNDFENGYAFWNDGGTDARLSNYSSYNNSGNYSVRLRDNSGSASSIYTDALNLLGHTSMEVSFSFVPNSMENGEDLLMEVSSNGGTSFTTLESWVAGSTMINETRYDVTIAVPQNMLSEQTVLRIRCDASSNADRVYVDDILIEVCGQGPNLLEDLPTEAIAVESNHAKVQDGLGLYPNPAIDQLNIELNGRKDHITKGQIFSIDGQLIKRIDQKGQKIAIDISGLDSGRTYMLILETNEGHRYIERFIKI